MPLPKFLEEQVMWNIKCAGETAESELSDSLKSMKSDQYTDNDGLTKEFYVTFLEEIKTHLSNSIRKSFLTEELSTSQK